MEVVCPSCGTAGQLAGKYCDNCGALIPADAGSAVDQSAAQADPSTNPVAPAPAADPDVTHQDPARPVPITDPNAQADTQTTAPQVAKAQFAVMRQGKPSPTEGFTINRVGEFLVGRMDQETGSQVDIDLRQWVQPIDIDGKKQFLIHRKQCYLGLAADGVVTLRPCPGSEVDTLVKGPGETTFTSLENLSTSRTARPDGSFELQLNDQIFMGDPNAVMYYLSGNPTAHDNYIVIELVSK